jgi:hypothetical protein
MPQRLAGKSVAAKTIVFFRRVSKYTVSGHWPQRPAVKNDCCNPLAANDLQHDFSAVAGESGRILGLCEMNGKMPVVCSTEAVP